MQNLIFRKKIGSVGGFLDLKAVDALPILLLFICYVLGFLIGYSYVRGLDASFLHLLSDKISVLEFKSVFILITLCNSLMTVFFVIGGLSIPGFFLVPALIAVFGISCASELCIFQLLYSGRVLFLFNLSLLIVNSSYGAFLIQYGKTATLLSYDIFRCFIRKDYRNTNISLKAYLSAGALILIISNICSAVKSLCVRLVVASSAKI